jgi:hypothetical protein
MNLFFCENLTLKTRLNLVEVYSRLVELIEIEDSDKQYQKKYVGRVFEKGFYLKKIRKMWWSSPTYCSKFSGAIRPDNGGTLLEIKVRLDRELLRLLPVSVVIFLIWISNSFIHFAAFPPVDLISLAFVLFGVLFFYFGELIYFNYERKKIKEQLMSYLEAELLF